MTDLNVEIQEAHDEYKRIIDNAQKLQEVLNAESNIRHNWLYSMIPATTVLNEYGITDTVDEIYLVGYCKQDNKYFTARLDRSSAINHVITGDLDIPKWGCKPNV